jgi:asparagine synthase (glutamine-hydrolysing)
VCGIAGHIAGTKQIESARVAAVLQHLTHRGPDDQGWLCFSKGELRTGHNWPADESKECELLLLHRRLAILDLSSNGWQPMSSNDGRYWIVFNGEIYNFIELRTELERLGHHFRSRSDTEVLLAAFAEWGVECLRRLVGMFAFAIFDRQRRTLFLARDFFGMKPLYYCSSAQGLSFASELTALLQFSQDRHHVNSSALLLYLRHGLSDQGATTLLEGVHQLPAAHYLELSLDDPHPPAPVCYWRPEGKPVELSFHEAAEKLRDLFLESVRLHLRSDVTVGAALSGGIDSSAIVACMRTVDPKLEIQAFSYIADGPLSEEKWIDVAAARARAQSHKIHTRSNELVSDLDALLLAQEEPFGGTSVYAQHRVFRRAQEMGIKVMLDGQGADELLGGYRYFMGAQLAALLRKGQYSNALKFVKDVSRLPGGGAASLAMCCADYMLPMQWQRPFRRLMAKELTPRWVRAEWFQQRSAETSKGNYGKETNALRSALVRTITETSLPHLLRYEDRNSMAFSIESRLPFLTPQIAEFLLGLPEEFIISLDGTSKAIFREAMRGIVPDPILDRRDKIGFATPERDWLRAMDGWVQDTLRSEAAADIPFLNLPAIEKEWQAILLGHQSFDNRVWRWLNIIRWSQHFQPDYTA